MHMSSTCPASKIKICSQLCGHRFDRENIYPLRAIYVVTKTKQSATSPRTSSRDGENRRRKGKGKNSKGRNDE